MQRPQAGRPTWYLDPLDGTVNFAHALPHFAVSLAFACGDATQFGIVHDPVRGETFEARRGGGATLDGAPIAVSQTVRLDEALLATGFPYDRRERLGVYLPFFSDFLLRARDVRRIGSAALDLCYVACGRFDGFWEWKLQPWDTAAGALVLGEAGGRVTDFWGAPFDLFGDQVLGTNACLHQAMVQVLTKRLEAVS